MSATKIACGLSIIRFHWMQATVARGLSTDELIMLSGVQLLIFAVAYAVWGPHGEVVFHIDLGTVYPGVEVHSLTE
jgi:hypothetical protein